MTTTQGIGFGNKPPIKQDPDVYAKKYAEEHNLSLEEAKKELRAQNGDPKKDNKIGANNDSLLNLNKTGSNEVPQGINPDDYAEVYAKMNNITVEKAKTELKQQFGDPQKKREGGKLNILA